MPKTLLALCAPLTLVSALVAETAPPAAALAADAAPAAPVGGAVELDALTVFSSRVALQEPSATFAAPVSALRFEPQVDVQARNFAEGQADVTIRGGTFENTGFSVGALPIYDPQTGHYSAELPVSPYLLGAPAVRTGTAQAATGFNATAGGVAYGWRPVRTGGAVSAAGGDNNLARGEVYAGVVAPAAGGGLRVGADVAVAASQGAGARIAADHDFARYNARLQLASDNAQTDFFAGYQSKNFGWPNLYGARPATPLRPEVERLQTKLFVLNHRVELAADGDYVQAGAYYRGNRDHYSIPDLIVVPGGFDTRHQTVVRGAAFDGRQTLFPGTALRYGGGVARDDLDSDSLVFGRYSRRTQGYGLLVGEHTLDLGESRELVLSAGARVDDSNRGGSEASPLASLELRETAGALRRAYLSYAETTQLPTYQALNASPAGLFGGNPDLRRATAANTELGVELALGGWTAQAAVFYREDRDLLDYVFDPTTASTARRAVNVDLDTYGFEAFVRRAWSRVDVMAGYAFLEKRDSYTRPDLASFYALNHAEHRFTLATTARLGGGFELRVDNELRRQADNALRREGRDNVDTAVGLFYHVPGVDGLVLNAQVDNLWDTAYQDVPLTPHTPRTWSVGATYVW